AGRPGGGELQELVSESFQRRPVHPDHPSITSAFDDAGRDMSRSAVMAFPSPLAADTQVVRGEGGEALDGDRTTAPPADPVPTVVDPVQGRVDHGKRHESGIPRPDRHLVL